MSNTKTKPKYRLEVEAPSNGRPGKERILAIDAKTKKVRHTDRADIATAAERKKVVNRIAAALGVKGKERAALHSGFEAHCNELANRRREQKEREAALAVMPPPAPEPPEAESERLLKETPPDVIRAAEELLRDPDLLGTICDDIEALGVAGEWRLAPSVYLVGTSRKLPNPLSGRIHGPSSSGKSYPLEIIAGMFPPEDTILATTMTPQALFHLPPGSLKHKFVGGGERSRREDNAQAEATRALREMISAGRLSKLMPVRGEGGLIRTERIEQEGPIAFVETTTLTKIFDEDANRCLPLQTDEGPEQTQRVYGSVAARYAGAFDQKKAAALIQRHRTMQRLLRRVEVVIPFARELVKLLPDKRVEGRRAVGLLLGGIAASALLHQFQRERDERGRVLATAKDYKVVKWLLAEPLGRILGGGISPAARRFYGRLKGRVARKPSRFRTPEAAKGEQVTERAVRGWLHELLDAGLVELLERGLGPNPAEWRLADAPRPGETKWDFRTPRSCLRGSYFRLSDKGIAAARVDRMRKRPAFPVISGKPTSLCRKMPDKTHTSDLTPLLGKG
jgi:hypothetical protein